MPVLNGTFLGRGVAVVAEQAEGAGVGFDPSRIGAAGTALLLAAMAITLVGSALVLGGWAVVERALRAGWRRLRRR